MLKRILVSALVLTLAAGVVFAGGGAAKDSSSSSGGVTTIRVWTNDAHNKVDMDALVAKFNDGIGKTEGIKVEYTVYGPDWDTAMNLALDTGKEPELFKGPTNIPVFQSQGKLLSWEEIPGIDDILKAQQPYHRNQATMFDGKIYSVALYGWSSGFHYNKSLLQRAGYSAPPKTWAEFEEMSIKISKLEPGKIYGTAMPLGYSGFRDWFLDYAAGSSVGHPLYNSTQVKYQTVDFTPYLEMMSRLREAGAMFPGMESLTDDQMRAQFANGTIGFILGGGWNVGVLYDQFPFGGGESGSPKDALGWDYAPMPVRDPNNRFATPMTAGASIYASAQLKNDPAKLAKVNHVIRLFCGDEVQSVLFTEGKNVPLRADIVAKAAPAKRPQWTSYGQSAGTTVTVPAFPHDFLAPEGATLNQVFSQIYTGQIKIADIRSALTDLDRRYNAAFDQDVTRGKFKKADYTDPTLETRFKTK